MKKFQLLAVLLIFILPVFLQGFVYLSDSEYIGLCGNERREYNAALEDEMASFERRQAEAEAASMLLEMEIEELKRQLSEINNDIAAHRQVAVTSEPERTPTRESEIVTSRNNPDTYTVIRGDYLSRIAGFSSIYGDWTRWPIIYRANQDQIRNPDLIYPGQILIIPRD